MGLRLNEGLGQITLGGVAALNHIVSPSALRVSGNAGMLTCGASVVTGSTDTSASYTSSKTACGAVSGDS